MSDYLPIEWDKIDTLVSRFSPSTVHCRNTALSRYFSLYLFERLISLYDFTMPDTWDPDFFRICLFGKGYLCVFYHPRYGVIPQPCTAYGYNVFYRPAHVTITNPLFKETITRDIDRDCILLKLKLDYAGVLPVVSLYADMMALACEASGVNLVNSKFAFMFATKNKAGAESWKKIYDQVQEGNPAAFFDKNLLNEDGTPNWHLFNRDVANSYINDKLLLDLKRIEHDFDEAVGVPSANTDKRERLIIDEVNANNIATECMPREIVKTVSRGFKAVKNMFDVDCSIKYIGRSTDNDGNDIL